MVQSEQRPTCLKQGGWGVNRIAGLWDSTHGGAVVCFPFSSLFSVQQCFSVCQNSLPLDSVLLASHLLPFSLSSLAFSKDSLTLCTSLFSHLFFSEFLLLSHHPRTLPPQSLHWPNNVYSVVCVCGLERTGLSGLCHEKLKGEDVTEDICLLVGF